MTTRADSDEEYDDEAADALDGVADVGNWPTNNLLVFKRYGVPVAPGDQPLMWWTTHACLDSSVTRLALFPGTSERIRVAVVALDEYALVNTSYPVTLRLADRKANNANKFRGQEKFASAANGAAFAAVLFPGHMSALDLHGNEGAGRKVLFEPPAQRMPRARELFPGISFDAVWNTVVLMTQNRVEMAQLDVDLEVPNDPRTARCPLGYVLSLDDDMHVTESGVKGGATRRYIEMSRDEAKAHALQFVEDARDPRPEIVASDLSLEMALAAPSASPAAGAARDPVLSVRVSVFFYTVPVD